MLSCNESGRRYGGVCAKLRLLAVGRPYSLAKSLHFFVENDEGQVLAFFANEMAVRVKKHACNPLSWLAVELRAAVRATLGKFCTLNEHEKVETEGANLPSV